MRRNESVDALDRLSKEAATTRRELGHNLFRRVALAAKLMADEAWLASEYKGDGGDAVWALQKAFFADLYDERPLASLLDALREMPTVEDWEKENFRLLNIVCLANRRRRERENLAPRHRATLTDVRKAETETATERREKEKVAAKAEKLREQVETAEERAERLERDLIAKDKEIARLNGIIEALKARLRKRGDAA